MAPGPAIRDDFGLASQADELPGSRMAADLARRKARDATHEKWDKHPANAKATRVRDMEDELPEGMKFVDSESNATEKEEAEYWIGHNQKSALKKEKHLVETTREANDRADLRAECGSAAGRLAMAASLRAQGLELKRSKDRSGARSKFWFADWLLRGDVCCDPPREAARHWHESADRRKEGLGFDEAEDDDVIDDVWGGGDVDDGAIKERAALRLSLASDSAAGNGSFDVASTWVFSKR